MNDDSNKQTCPYCGGTETQILQTVQGNQLHCSGCGNTFTPGAIVHASLGARTEVAPAPVLSPAAATGFRCPVCCAPAGQPCAAGCTGTGLAGAVSKAIGMLAMLDPSKVPLAVPAVVGVLNCALEAAADQWTSAASPPDDDVLVLLALSDGETWPGFRDGGIWRYVTAEPIESARVTDWRHMPAGPGSRTAPDEVRNQAARDVLAERRRQVGEEGWTQEHDDKYEGEELRWAALCYMKAETITKPGILPGAWPWPAHWWKPSTDRRNLIKAGALVLAEIERIDRASLRTPSTNGEKGGA